MKLSALHGARIAVLGLGREGRALVRVLAGRVQYASLEVICEQPPETVSEVLPEGIPLRIGPLAAADLARFDVLIKSPGISLYHPAIRAAVEQGVTLTSGSNFWFAERPLERVVAITGTKGKSTTAALTAHLLKGAGLEVQLAGNIGVPLIGLLDASADVWVLELSSFQIADLRAAIDTVVLVSLFDEHLDWHQTAERYRSDKLRLLDMARQRIVLPAALRAEVGKGFRQSDGPEVILYGAPGRGWHPDAGGLSHPDGRAVIVERIPLRGRHNLLNACAAMSVADALQAPWQTLSEALPAFQPLPHRLQTVARNGLVEFINDSIATTPQATAVALEALAGERICLLAGGHDRGLDWRPLLDCLAEMPVHAVIGLPDTGPALLDGIRKRSAGEGWPLPEGGLWPVNDLTEAFAVLELIADGRLTVLLSPGAASFSQFRNFEQRGERFAELARAYIAGRGC